MALARAIAAEDAGRRIHLIGHSHGGNVALAAINNLLAARVESVILLANPHMLLIDPNGGDAEPLYWGRSVELVRNIWNLYSPEDFVQTTLAERFHGVPLEERRAIRVRPDWIGSPPSGVQGAAIHWKPSWAAHRSMHSEAMGTVVGSILMGKSIGEAMADSGLSITGMNKARDRGGWPGAQRTFGMIRDAADPAPFDYDKATTSVGVLFLHGFTASPAEMRPMASFVSQLKHWRCTGPLLPGHGTTIEDMQRSRSDAWLGMADEAYEQLAQQCDRVFIVGLSLGAVLACHVALRRSGDPKLRGIVLLAPAFGVTLKHALGIHLLRPVRYLRNKGARASDYFLDHRLFSYLHVPVGLAAEVLKLGSEAVRNMSKLRKIPTLMFVGDRESTVSLEKMLAVTQAHPSIRLVRMPKSRHILTVEPDREMMFETSVRFMEECLGEFAQ
jgi:carboxylesterase